jgi:hypothetical protein
LCGGQCTALKSTAVSTGICLIFDTCPRDDWLPHIRSAECAAQRGDERLTALLAHWAHSGSELRGARCYVEFRTARRRPLFCLSADLLFLLRSDAIRDSAGMQ